MTETSRAVEKLYAVPLRSFTRERNAMAVELAKSGRADEARAVKRLRRPPALLWAANQLAHVEVERLAAWLDTVDRARAAQLQSPHVAADALRRQRSDLDALVRRAGALLGEQGYRATADTARRLSGALLGAAV